MNDDCKIDLPIIKDADYERYQDITVYRQIYTVLWAAPYSAWWNQSVWAHAWLDVATARGTPLYSIWNGLVTYAWWQAGYGNVVKIKYLFRWQYIHAVYGHMDTIDVKAGQYVSAGQQIWTVGNTWTVMWALWWFHVHFEINRDFHGRPAYAYRDCIDLPKWHFRIIQDGLCREELFFNQYDPIVLFEQNRLWYVSWLFVNREIEGETERLIDIETPNGSWSIGTQRDSLIVSEEDVLEGVWWSINPDDKISDKIIDQIQETKIDRQIDEETERQIDLEFPNGLDPLIVSDRDVLEEVVLDDDGREWEKVNIVMDDSWSEEVKHFFRTHELYVLGSDMKNMSVWSNKEIEFLFYKRWSDDTFVWLLPFLLDMVGTNTNINTNYSSVQLVSSNGVKLNVRWESEWESTLVFYVNGVRILSFKFVVG